VALTLPLLEGTDGVEKMSKSLGNAVGITDSPDEIYGRTMSIPDAILPRWCELLGRPEWSEMHSLREEVQTAKGNPRDLKAALARRLVERFRGATAALAAEERFVRMFRDHEAPDDMPEIEVSLAGGEGIPVVDLLTRAEFAASRGEGKRLIAQGGVRLDGQPVESPEARVEPGQYVLQAGKRRFARIRVRSSV
jgi:tyrosyl-tRNA synthetase